MKYILITGVSTGVGNACVKYFLEKDYFVFGSVRKQLDADKLLIEFPNNFKPLIFDVTDVEAIQRAVQEVKYIVKNKGLTGLVNNAGIAYAGTVQYLPLEKWKHQFQVNVFGIVNVTQAFLPLLGAVENCTHPSGRIIQISSVAGIVATPFMGAYSASKFALEGLSDSLRREIAIFNIKVITIQLGPVHSPMIQKTLDASADYKDTPYSANSEKRKRTSSRLAANSISPNVVAKKIYKIMEKKNPNSRYLIAKQKWKMWLVINLPNKWMDRYFNI